VELERKRAAAGRERAALHDQMAMEAALRKQLDDAKAAQTAAARADLFASLPAAPRGGAASSARPAAASAAGGVPSASRDIFGDVGAEGEGSASRRVVADGHDELGERAVPAARGHDGVPAGAAAGAGGTSVVPLSFTARALPTPARESKAAEESEWLARNLARQAALGKKEGASGTGTTVSRSAVLSFAAQAAQFFKTKDWRSCLSALQTLQISAPGAVATVPLVAAMQAYCLRKTGVGHDAVSACLAAAPPVGSPSTSPAATAMQLTAVINGACATADQPSRVQAGLTALAAAGDAAPPSPLVAALADVAAATAMAAHAKHCGNGAVKDKHPIRALAWYLAGLSHPHPTLTPTLLLNCSRAYTDMACPPAAALCVRRAERALGGRCMSRSGAVAGVADGEAVAELRKQAATRLAALDKAAAASSAATAAPSPT